MEGALAAWQQRLEQERVDQGYFTSEAEAFKHGCARARARVACHLPATCHQPPQQNPAAISHTHNPTYPHDTAASSYA